MGLGQWVEDNLVMWPKDWSMGQRRAFSEAYDKLAEGAEVNPVDWKDTPTRKPEPEDVSDVGVLAMKFGFLGLQQYGVESHIADQVRTYHDIFEKTPAQKCLDEIRAGVREMHSLPIQGLNREQVLYLIRFLELRTYGLQSSQRRRLS